MPNIWTHILFCEEIADAIREPDSLSAYDTFMNLGAQGPDPFFYYNFWPWVKNEPVHHVGMALHTKHCGDFLIDLIIEAKNMEKPVQAYIFGFITHHILDRNTHPYIHYRAGYKGSRHQKLEVIIDTLMMDRYRNLKTWKIPVYKEINVGKHLHEDIKTLLHAKITKHYPELNRDSSEYIEKAYSDMILALKILADPYKWKNKLLKNLISSYSHQPVNDDMDYLNINGKTWHHSATYDPSDKSFIDLYENSLKEGIDILTEVTKFWYTKTDESMHLLVKRIGNISYDTGKPLKLNLDNKYSDPIV
ncbi:zinc dependent phospholipase C family protein [Virgibacillus ainsalahensis]